MGVLPLLTWLNSCESAMHVNTDIIDKVLHDNVVTLKVPISYNHYLRWGENWRTYLMKTHADIYEHICVRLYIYTQTYRYI